MYEYTFRYFGVFKTFGNNEREWFFQHKSLYEAAHKNFISFVNEVINAFAESYPEIGNLNAKSTLFRIYRDIRFSPNKDAFKINFAATLVKERKKTVDRAGYYIHIQLGNCMLAGDIYIKDKKSLVAIRKKISTDPDEFLKTIENKYFIDNLIMHGDTLKRVPRGFDEKDPMVAYLKLKEFVIYHALPDAEVVSPSFVSKCCKIFKAAKLFNEFINEAIINYYHSEHNN
ncbi:DUF2461 domain-containing protein [Elizabethkingia argenteiflava]|uniref:DUF2461 domain-containing protein n=1 Tax=Elizabethkingia argenteiflava TaxID=2681556 RepID=UPI00293BFD00|nr:DUF2461 domain-containing protein [Elizabethkingia argenteiflava]